MYAINSHRCTHLTLDLGIIREPTVWEFITSQYPDTHNIGLPRITGLGLVLTTGPLRATVFLFCGPPGRAHSATLMINLLNRLMAKRFDTFRLYSNFQLVYPGVDINS